MSQKATKQISKGIDAPKQHSHKRGPTVSTYPSPTTSHGLGPTSRRLEAGRQTQHLDLLSDRDQLQHPTTACPAVCPRPTGPTGQQRHHQVHHPTPTNPVPPQGGRGMEPLVDDNLVDPVTRHTAPTETRSFLRGTHTLPRGCTLTSPASSHRLSDLNTRITSNTLPL